MTVAEDLVEGPCADDFSIGAWMVFVRFCGSVSRWRWGTELVVWRGTRFLVGQNVLLEDWLGVRPVKLPPPRSCRRVNLGVSRLHSDIAKSPDLATSSRTSLTPETHQSVEFRCSVSRHLYFPSPMTTSRIFTRQLSPGPPLILFATPTSAPHNPIPPPAYRNRVQTR